MSDNSNGAGKNGGKHSVDWTKILTGALGAALLGLQGINISEVTQVGEQGRQRAIALEGIEKSLENQTAILEGLETSIKQNGEILANGSKMLDSDSQALQNQQKILDLLQKNLEARNSHP
jgi:hypothetical protein